MNLLPQFFYGMVVIGSLSMVGDVSVDSAVFDQLFLNAEYHGGNPTAIRPHGRFWKNLLYVAAWPLFFLQKSGHFIKKRPWPHGRMAGRMAI